MHHNKLLSAAHPLLFQVAQIRCLANAPDMPALREACVNQLKQFEQSLRALDYPTPIMMAAHYCLCTALDEAVLSQAWGKQSAWMQPSLLSLFHQASNGGERFYQLLDSAIAQPRRQLAFLNLCYYLLCLGFEGQFFGEHHKTHTKIMSRLQALLHQLNPQAALRVPMFDHQHLVAESVIAKHQQLKKHLKVVLIIIASMAIFFNVKFHRVMKPVNLQIEQLVK
jgi:type IV/VI secretion system ImpK/VasF family protein